MLFEPRTEVKLVVGGDGQAGPTLPGSSSSLAIWCIFLWRALIRPFVKRCLAAMQRMWSSNVKVADNRGTVREAGTCKEATPDDDLGLCTVTWRHLESSLSVTTSKSCKNPTKVATPHPRRVASGSTNTI